MLRSRVGCWARCITQSAAGCNPFFGAVRGSRSAQRGRTVRSPTCGGGVPRLSHPPAGGWDGRGMPPPIPSSQKPNGGSSCYPGPSSTTTPERKPPCPEPTTSTTATSASPPPNSPTSPPHTTRSMPNPAAASRGPAISPSKSDPTSTTAPSSDIGKWTPLSPASTATAACSCSSNANRLVRRWYPKGTDFSKVSWLRIAGLEDAIISIHRRLLQGRTAHETYLAAA